MSRQLPVGTGGRVQSESLVVFRRIRWSPSIGIGGRIASDSAAWAALARKNGLRAAYTRLERQPQRLGRLREREQTRSRIPWIEPRPQAAGLAPAKRIPWTQPIADRLRPARRRPDRDKDRENEPER